MDAGNKGAPKADGEFSNAPYFNWNDGQLKFNTNDVSNFNPNYGSASFRLPNCSSLGKRSVRGAFYLSD